MTDLTCPFGHAVSTSLPPGSSVRCQQCREQGNAVTVTVPSGPEPAAAVRVPREHTGWLECSRCRTWSQCPGDRGLPPGWLTLIIGTDPAADPRGRASKTLGPFCSLPCVTIAQKSTPRGETDRLRALMREPPKGRDR